MHNLLTFSLLQPGALQAQQLPRLTTQFRRFGNCLRDPGKGLLDIAPVITTQLTEREEINHIGQAAPCIDHAQSVIFAGGAAIAFNEIHNNCHDVDPYK